VRQQKPKIRIEGGLMKEKKDLPNVSRDANAKDKLGRPLDRETWIREHLQEAARQERERQQGKLPPSNLEEFVRQEQRNKTPKEKHNG
jgi:hypothetical protein